MGLTRNSLTQDLLIELFEYNSSDGCLYRIVARSNAVKIGDKVGTNTGDGYLCVGIGRKLYLVHRVIWCWHYGDMPDYEIDHIDQDKTNNRIENLRAVTHQENSKNCPVRVTNSSGWTGVYWSKAAGKWQSYITVDGKSKYLGVFDNLNDAIKVRKLADVAQGFHPNHGNLPTANYGLDEG